MAMKMLILWIWNERNTIWSLNMLPVENCFFFLLLLHLFWMIESSRNFRAKFIYSFFSGNLIYFVFFLLLQKSRYLECILTISATLAKHSLKTNTNECKCAAVEIFTIEKNRENWAFTFYMNWNHSIELVVVFFYHPVVCSSRGSFWKVQILHPLHLHLRNGQSIWNGKNTFNGKQ